MYQIELVQGKHFPFDRPASFKVHIPTEDSLLSTGDGRSIHFSVSFLLLVFDCLYTARPNICRILTIYHIHHKHFQVTILKDFRLLS